jgi:cytochrome c oxidase subunit 3
LTGVGEPAGSKKVADRRRTEAFRTVGPTLKGLTIMPVITEDKRISVPPPIWPKNGRGDDGGGSDDSHSSFPISKQQLGLWVLLTAVIMLFAGLTSAYIVLRGVPAWQNIQLPSLLWPNTVILLLSSITIEISQRAIRRNQIAGMKRWLAISAVLGLMFVVGQLAAWRQLVNSGVYLPSTLQSSFFYILTGLHGIHIAGGIVALGFVMFRAANNRLTIFNHQPLKLCATYWHFMDGLWLYLFVLLLLS